MINIKGIYYEPPEDHIFEEVKRETLTIWKGYDDTHGYSSEKQALVKPLRNIGDNFMYLVAMFDLNNQQKLATMISAEAREAIRFRLIDGGTYPDHIVF